MFNSLCNVYNTYNHVKRLNKRSIYIVVDRPKELPTLKNYRRLTNVCRANLNIIIRDLSLERKKIEISIVR